MVYPFFVVLYLGDPGVVPVDVDPLLGAGLAVPHDGEEIATFMNTNLAIFLFIF